MSIAEISATISPPVIRLVKTGADKDAPISTETMSSERDAVVQKRDGWQMVLDEKLLPWLRNPATLEDDGIDAPTGTILRLAIDLAENYRDSGLTPPTHVVPDPNGGIVFERIHRAGVTEIIHIWEDGIVEYFQLHGSEITDRRLL